MPGARGSSSAVATRTFLSEPKCLSSSRLRFCPTPGTSSSAERSVRRRRSFLWKVTAKRCASSRMRASRNISAELGRSFIGSLAFMRKTRSGCFSPFSSSRSLASATTSMPFMPRSICASRSAATAVPSCPLPPSMTSRSGATQPFFGSPAFASGAVLLRRKRRDSTSYIEAKSSLVARLDLEGAVLALGRLAVEEHHHRRHRRRALDVRDVEALDAPRQPLEAQPLLQLLQRRLGVARLVAPRDERRGRVLLRQRDQLVALRRAAAPSPRPVALAALLAQPLRLGRRRRRRPRAAAPRRG